MKQLYYAMLYILIGTLSIVSCRWESEEDFVDPCNSTITWTPVQQDTCFELPITPLGFVDATMHSPAIRLPNYCPYDADRFVYVHVEIYPEENTVINTANICTGEKQLVTSSDYVPYPQWGTTDWILFNRTNGPLYVVKSNGDSLKLLNPLSGMRGCFWINDGQTILTKWKKNSSEQYNLLLNTTGDIIDTISTSIGMGAYKNHRIAVWGYINDQFKNYIGIIDSESWLFTPLLPYDANNIPTSINWLDDETIVLSKRSGLFKVNIITQEVTTIKETPCDNMGYGPVSAAPDGSGKILTTRVEYIYVKPDSLVLYQRISLLDANTGQEWILGLE